MRISEVKEAIMLSFATRVPVFIHGAPGIGKSDAVRQIGAETGRKVFDLRLSLLSPVDLRGVPYCDAVLGITRWLPPMFLPNPGIQEDVRAILFLDEFNMASQAVQAAAYQLVLDRKLGEYVLPAGVDIIAAGNRAEDHAIVNNMSSALRTRFLHISAEPDLKEWKTWAVSEGVAHEVISFLSYKPERLYYFDPKTHTHSFPTPRTWAFTASLLGAMRECGKPLSEAFTLDMFKSSLGEAAAVEFNGFIGQVEMLPDVEPIIIGGDLSAKPPKNIDALYLFYGALLACVLRQKGAAMLPAMRNLLAYLAKLPREFAILAFKEFCHSPAFSSGMRRQVIQMEEFTAFTNRYAELLNETP